MRQFFIEHMRRPTIGRRMLAACVLAFAQFATGVACAADGAFDQGLLWRIEKPGAAPSYLFGTVHLADKRVTTLPDEVRKRFDAAKAFAMEVSADQTNVARLAGRMVYQDGRDLQRVAGDDLYRRVVPLTDGLGLPAEMVKLFKPWALVLLLQMPQQQMEDVLDFTLQRMALEQGKALLYLETVDEQVGAFENMPEADQIALLRHAVETHHELKAETERLLQAYLQRDLAAMWRIGEADMARRPDLKALKRVFDQRLLYDRNTRMVERMRTQLAAGQAFIAVGALHLHGEKGLLVLLAREGYRVTREY
jgi:uncharacterized protein YbaP (TraB family)